MRKLNKLFAMLVAMLGVGTLSAQTDVTSTYLTNADFSSTDGWTAYVSDQYRDYGSGNIGSALGSYAASTTDDTHLASERFFGFQCRWNGNFASYNQETTQVLPAGVYTLGFDVENVNGSTTAATYNNLFYVKVGDNTFTDTSVEWMKGSSGWTSHSIAFVITEASKATVSLGYGTGSNNLASANTPVLYVSHLKLTYKPFSDVTSENPADLTSMVSGNWLNSGGSTAAITAADACGGLEGVSEAYQWGDCLATGGALKKSIENLPVGKYNLEIYCASSTTSGRDNTNYPVTDGDEQYVTLNANDNSQAIPTYNRTAVDAVALYAFNDLEITDGKLDLAVNINVASPNWIMAKVKSITYLGPDKTLYEEAFNTKYASLSELSTEGIPTTFATKITELKTQYGSVDATSLTLAELENANIAMDGVLNSYDGVATAYASLDELITLCTGYVENSQANSDDVLTTFQTAISTATTDGNAATTVDAINTAYSTLETARQTYVQKADPINGTFFDYTFKITNPGLDNGTNGWVSEGGAQNKAIATNKTNGIITGAFFENWNGSAFTGSISQSVAGLPSGKYKFKAAAFGVGTYVFANDGQTAVTTTDGAWYEVEVTLADGNLTFGLKNDNAIDWMGIDNASLYFYGFDVATAQARVTDLKSQAEALVAKPMNATVLAALNEAITNADATKTTRSELETMTTALSTAVANANASIADYENILTYITKANGIDASIAADYQAQYDNRTIAETSETVFQNLEVATYNYVTTNFTYPVELEANGWIPEGPVGTMTSQHYDGTSTSSYLEQSSAAWGSSAWEISYKYEKTLPAGKYIFKVAGRREAGTGTTMNMQVTNINDSANPVVLGSVNDFPEGDTGLGINKNGVTSFDANDEVGFANNNIGRGWQWRYVMFELEGETTVQVAVYAAATTEYQWMSFCGATVQMTEETYLEANKGGVEAAEAAAQALVDTIPMGDAEKDALSEALAMTYTTGAEMLAKVEALETAVANANAWLTAYNEAKAPLVAALERFEADYNDGENGAKDHMAKSRWETVLAMVQAATEAKDVTNSYDGFAAATENLVAALDAATVSVNEYADLKKAIDAANALAAVEVNWGDEPFQRPASAKAGLDTTDEQAVYDAATADGEGVTSVTGALNAAMDITLNVPATGDAYYITVATAGHAYEGYPIVATSGSTGDNNPTGYGYTANATDATATKLYTFTQVEGNLYNISFEMNGETVYMTYGSLNGSAADWKDSQIQGNTDVTKAGTFEIEASTTTEGAIKICNTVTGTYLDCQAGGPIYTDDALTNEEFALIEQNTQLSASINISSENQLSTCVLQFDATLPEGLEAYVGTSVENGCLILEQVTAEALPAYTPCLLYAENGATATLTGTIVMDGYAHQVTTDNLLYGAIKAATITEGYVLQNQGEGAKFHTVGGQTVTVPAGKCWLTVPQSSETDATPAAVSLRFTNGGATKLNPVLMDKTVQDGAIYTIDGKRVERMERGQIYIINGQKVMIK